jgi:hypothetical protein
MEALAYLGLRATKVDDEAVTLLCRHLRRLVHLDLSQCTRVTSMALLSLQGARATRSPASSPRSSGEREGERAWWEQTCSPWRRWHWTAPACVTSPAFEPFAVRQPAI